MCAAAKAEAQTSRSVDMPRGGATHTATMTTTTVNVGGTMVIAAGTQTPTNFAKRANARIRSIPLQSQKCVQSPVEM